jgi:hypothetical protein
MIEKAMPEKVPPQHECQVCRGEKRQPPELYRHCPRVRIRDGYRQQIVEKLRQKRLYRGEAEIEELIARFWRLRRMIEENGGKVSGKWLIGAAEFARVIVDERERILRLMKAPAGQTGPWRHAPKVNHA